MDEILFYDPIGGVYFRTTIAGFTYMLLMLNRKLVFEGWASMNDMYDLLNIPHVEDGDIRGWASPEFCDWIDISTERMATDDGLEVYMLVYTDEDFPRLCPMEAAERRIILGL